VVIATILAIVQVASDMLGQLCQAAREDTSYKKLVDFVRKGTIHSYWLKQDLLYAKRGRIFLSKREMQKYLMIETHDAQWAGHLGRERMVALISNLLLVKDG